MLSMTLVFLTVFGSGACAGAAAALIALWLK